jgi:hypothetical protein
MYNSDYTPKPSYKSYDLQSEIHARYQNNSAPVEMDIRFKLSVESVNASVSSILACRE